MFSKMTGGGRLLGSFDPIVKYDLTVQSHTAVNSKSTESPILQNKILNPMNGSLTGK